MHAEKHANNQIYSNISDSNSRSVSSSTKNVYTKDTEDGIKVPKCVSLHTQKKVNKGCWTPHINKPNRKYNMKLKHNHTKRMNAFHVYVYYEKYANFPEGCDIYNL